MGILTTSRRKSIGAYHESVLREELEKINAACERFFARRGVVSRRSVSHRRSKVTLVSSFGIARENLTRVNERNRGRSGTYSRKIVRR